MSLDQLHYIFSNPDLTSLYEKYLQRIYAWENYGFFVRVEAYKKIDTVALKAEAQSIFEDFIQVDAENELGDLDYRTRKYIEEQLDEPSADLFDELSEIALDSLANSTVTEFLRDKTFNEYFESQLAEMDQSCGQENDSGNGLLRTIFPCIPLCVIKKHYLFTLMESAPVEIIPLFLDDYEWDKDVEYARFIIKAVRRGYFTTKEDENISQTDCEQRLLHLKKFYCRRVLHRVVDESPHSNHFKALLFGEAAIIRKLVCKKKKEQKVSDLFAASSSSLLANISSLSETSEFQLVVRGLEFAVLLDQMKKKYAAFAESQHTMSNAEKRKKLRELGGLSMRLSTVSANISSNVIKTQFVAAVDRSIAWAQQERAKTLISDRPRTQGLRRRAVRGIRKKFLAEFSWFPHSRL